MLDGINTTHISYRYATNSTDKVEERWNEYFEGLLNPTDNNNSSDTMGMSPSQPAVLAYRANDDGTGAIGGP